jgi:hypothetical protein
MALSGRVIAHGVTCVSLAVVASLVWLLWVSSWTLLVHSVVLGSVSVLGIGSATLAIPFSCIGGFQNRTWTVLILNTSYIVLPLSVYAAIWSIVELCICLNKAMSPGLLSAIMLGALVLFCGVGAFAARVFLRATGVGGRCVSACAMVVGIGCAVIFCADLLSIDLQGYVRILVGCFYGVGILGLSINLYIIAKTNSLRLEGVCMKCGYATAGCERCSECGLPSDNYCD